MVNKFNNIKHYIGTMQRLWESVDSARKVKKIYRKI